MRLKNFFQDEARFSRQFQQVYEILNQNGRGHNPALVLAVFRELRRYKHALTIPEDVQRTFRGRTREEHIDGYYTNIYAVFADSSWFNLEFLTEEGKEDAKRIRERLVNEAQGMEELPRDVMDYGSSHGMSSGSKYGRALLSGEEEMLVPYEGWYEEARFLRQSTLPIQTKH